MEIRLLYVLYDAECGVCSQVRKWLMEQPRYVELQFILLQNPRLSQYFPGVDNFHPSQEIVVISDQGAVYCGAQAWVMCLWALQNYRTWSLRFAKPELFPWVQKFCYIISKNRFAVSRLLRIRNDAKLLQELQSESSICMTGACKS